MHAQRWLTRRPAPAGALRAARGARRRSLSCPTRSLPSARRSEVGTVERFGGGCRTTGDELGRSREVAAPPMRHAGQDEVVDRETRRQAGELRLGASGALDRQGLERHVDRGARPVALLTELAGVERPHLVGAGCDGSRQGDVRDHAAVHEQVPPPSQHGTTGAPVRSDPLGCSPEERWGVCSMQAGAKSKGVSRSADLGRRRPDPGVKPTLRGAATVGTGRAVGSRRSPRPPGSAPRSSGLDTSATAPAASACTSGRQRLGPSRADGEMGFLGRSFWTARSAAAWWSSPDCMPGARNSRCWSRRSRSRSSKRPWTSLQR